MGSRRKPDGLSKQGGVSYNPTLDEAQHQLGDLGKPLKSMNLDRNVGTGETGGNSNNNQGGSASVMARQSSLTDSSKKAVGELWQDIQHGLMKMDSVGSSSDFNVSSSGYNLDDRKSKHETLGEMTLEDFLAKAGIEPTSSPERKKKKKKNSGSVIEYEPVVLPQQVKQQQADWMQYQIPPFQQRQQQHVFMPGHHQDQKTIMDMDFPEAKVKICPTPLMGTLSDTQMPGRKRHASGDVIEKTVERRQKRMIKNRESAARSRARKQAYTNELESKVSLLKEENERLKREQEIDNALPYTPLSEPKYQLRRTSSI